MGVIKGTANGQRFIHLELRHRTRGPVGTLCRINTVYVTEKIELELDGLVDVLTKRLGIRRSGSHLHPMPIHI